MPNDPTPGRGEAWRVIADAAHGLVMEAPMTTSTGEPVAIDQVVDGPIHRLHAHSRDGSSIYVEVLSYPGIVAHGPAVAEQRHGLRERAPEARVGDPRPGTVAGHDATVFDFDGVLGGSRRPRRFAWVDAAGRTYRIVTDPTSAANERILATLRFGADGR